MPITDAARRLALAAVLATAGTAWAQPQALSRADRDFLEKAAHATAAEIEAGRLAQTRATRGEVRRFAQHMVEAHTRAGDELRQLAKAKGVQVPAEAALTQKARIKILSGRQGEDFDRDYAEDIAVKAHGDMAKLLQKAAQESKDPDVKAYAQKTLAVVQEHLKTGQSLHTQMSARTGTLRGPAASAASK